MIELIRIIQGWVKRSWCDALTAHHGLHVRCVPASQIHGITAGRSDPVEDVTHIRHPEHIPVANGTTNNKSTCASTKVRCAVVKSYASFGHLKHLLFVGRIVAIGCYICRQRGLISVCAVRKGWWSTGRTASTEIEGIREGGSVPVPEADYLVEGCRLIEHLSL